MPEKRKLDLRRRPQPQPPPAAPPPTLRETLGPALFQPGRLIDPKFMTTWERKQLEAIGWEPGTPVPGNAAELIAAAQKEATSELLPVPPDTPPLEMPEPVDISRLSAAKQQELREALADAAHYQEQFQAQEAAVAGKPAGIAEAIRVADRVTQEGQPNLGISVVDDRPPRPAAVPAAARPTGWRQPDPPPESKPTGWRQPAPPPQPAPPEPAADPPVGDLSDAGGIGITHCPHCNWDLKRPDPSTPTDDDKRTYLMATLAGPGHRFTREIVLLGGTVRVGYRELTGGEADAALTQIAEDVRKSRVVGDGEWWQRLMDYRMTQAIDYIEIRSVGRVHEGVDLADIESDDGNSTPYPALIDHLLGSVLQSESLRRAIGQGFMRFQRLCEKLEANADEESFWNGIGSLR
jgi:hypothetical protein